MVVDVVFVVVVVAAAAVVLLSATCTSQSSSVAVLLPRPAPPLPPAGARSTRSASSRRHPSAVAFRQHCSTDDGRHRSSTCRATFARNSARQLLDLCRPTSVEQLSNNFCATCCSTTARPMAVVIGRAAVEQHLRDMLLDNCSTDGGDRKSVV